MRTSRLTKALVGALAAACVLSGSAAAASRCGTYSYAGLQAPKRAHGVAATITLRSTPNVLRGHVAGWIGVGGQGMGPKGSTEWIQVGLSAFPGSESRIYYEVTQPGWAARYVDVGISVAPGERHRVAVLEVGGRAGAWRVWVDGRAVSPAYYLPGSHGGWKPEATAESWNDGGSVCNGYTYRFSGLVLASRPGGSWQSLAGGFEFEDPGYRMVRRSAASFDARAQV